MKQTHLSVAPVTMPKPSSGTILGHLTVLGITIADIAQCLSLEDEWAFIKKHHFNHIKVCHPDKGGDAETFRAVNDSFNVLRELVSKKQVKRFASESAAHAPESRSSAQAEHAPWAWYEESSKVDFVPYIVEPAKSDRSKCNKKTKKDPCVHGGKIAKGHLRIGSWNEDVGGYSWYVHLECWRVPAKIWLAFPSSPSREQIRDAMHLLDSVSICGFSEMSPEQQDIFVEHVMNPDNWARTPSNMRKSKSAQAMEALELGETKSAVPGMAQLYETNHPDSVVPHSLEAQQVCIKDEDALGASVSLLSHTALVVRAGTPQKRGGAFVMPIPGKDGAVCGAMAGLNVVLTGLFPEVGGGSGLNLGKDRVKGMVEAFGGKVTGAVSGRTHILVVGKEPGMGKVTQAEGQPNCQLMYLEDLREALQNGQDVLAPKERPVMVTNFSSGYKGNGLGGRLKNHAEVDPKPRPIKRIKEASDTKIPKTRQKKAKAADID